MAVDAGIAPRRRGLVATARCGAAEAVLEGHHEPSFSPAPTVCRISGNQKARFRHRMP